jgi:bud site selection protein 31
MAPRWGKKKPPADFDYVEPIMEALENELRDKVKETNEGKRKTESMWPVHQINWQKSRYIYDLFYTYKRISRPVYDYCIDQKLVDAALIAKWKKPGYERLCSTYVINPTNYKFGTTSLCRVPLFDRSEEQRAAQDPTVRHLRKVFRQVAALFSHQFIQYLDWLSRLCIRKGGRTKKSLWQQVWSELGSGPGCA